MILLEAGGQVTAYNGSPLEIKSGRVLATNGKIHTQLSNALKAVPPLSSWPSVIS